MEEYLHQAFTGVANLAGFIVSTGAAMAQGTFTDEGFQTERGSIALRRNLSPLRVRETLIVPMPDRGLSLVEFLATAYATEPNSLDRSLQLAGLGTIFPRPPYQPRRRTHSRLSASCTAPCLAELVSLRISEQHFTLRLSFPEEFDLT